MEYAFSKGSGNNILKEQKKNGKSASWVENWGKTASCVQDKTTALMNS